MYMYIYILCIYINMYNVYIWQGASSRALLEDFSRWKPGPAGRRGKRCSDDGSEDDIDGEDQSPYSTGAEVPVYRYQALSY